MDPIDQLKADALKRRNEAILAAKREYHAALREIARLKRKLKLRKPDKPRKPSPGDFFREKASVLAREILREGRPMSLVELTLEVQRRGCRTHDDPRALAHVIAEGLRYHKREFPRDEKGRWGVTA
jgi:hypothetical protein